LGGTSVEGSVHERPGSDISYPHTIPFIVIHLLCLGAVWTGVHVGDLVLCVSLYYIRLFGVTAGYHRYFSHRTFKTSRVGQFLLGWLAQTSAQQGILWWAAKHRQHHRYSDLPGDVHSPRQHGMWYAHVGWIFARRNFETAADLDKVKDLAQYPELVWLDRQKYLPATLLGFATWWAFGWSGLVVGFFWSTVLAWHGTFTINSLAHGIGRRRFYTGDDSRNNWFLAAVVTLGEGWHNNHHYFRSSTRQGFRWWEVDLTYYGLVALSRLRLVSSLTEPPRQVIRGERRVSHDQVVRAEAELTAGIPRRAKDAEPALGILMQAASESIGPLAARARTALAELSASVHPYAERAQESWLKLIDQAHERLLEARDAFDARSEHAFAVLSEAVHHAIDPVAARAREKLAHVAESVHPYAERARDALARLAESLDAQPEPAPA
jgi:stearoyl-CoA desaturase (delta-9 desaturase)